MSSASGTHDPILRADSTVGRSGEVAHPFGDLLRWGEKIREVDSHFRAGRAVGVHSDCGMPFFELLNARQRRRLARVFGLTAQDPCDPTPWPVSKRRLEACSRRFLLRFLRVLNLAASGAGDLTTRFEPSDSGAVQVATVHGSLISLGERGRAGLRQFAYEPLGLGGAAVGHHVPRSSAGLGVSGPGTRPAPQSGWTRLAGPLVVGQRLVLESLLVSPLAIIVRFVKSTPRQDVFRTVIPALHSDSVVRDALGRYRELTERLASPGERGASEIRDECEALGEAIFLQSLLADGNATPSLDDVDEIRSESGTSYRLERAEGTIAVVRQSPLSPPLRLRSVSIGPQQIVLGAPLAFFAVGTSGVVDLACWTTPVTEVRMRQGSAREPVIADAIARGG